MTIKGIAESFNEYFSNLTVNIKQPLVPYTSYIPQPKQFSFFLRSTTILEVQSTINNLDLTTAGLDEININVIKACSVQISLGLTSPQTKLFTAVSMQNIMFLKVLNL